jgi:predicted nucleic acid-binding protein
MKLDDALVGVTTLGFDTAPFIYFVERHPSYMDLMREVIRRVNGGMVAACTSVITLTEVLVQPKRVGDTRLANEYQDLLLHSRNFTMLAVDVAIADRAATLRAAHTLRTPDAIQVAAALEVGCEAFLTNDGRLGRVRDLRVLVLDDLEL